MRVIGTALSAASSVIIKLAENVTHIKRPCVHRSAYSKTPQYWSLLLHMQ